MRIVKRSENFDQCGGRIDHRSAENAGVQVGGRAAQKDLHGGNAAEALGQGGITFGHHAGVRNGDDVAAEFVAPRADEVIQMRTARLFLALNEEDEVDRQRAFLAEEVDGAEQMGENLAFVVGRSAGKDALVAEGRFEGWGGPEVKWFFRLDVVMSVYEHGGFSRGLGSVSQDGGVSAGFAHLGFEPAVAEEGLEPPGAGPHLGGVVGFGRDGRKAQELEEQVEIGLP